MLFDCHETKQFSPLTASVPGLAEILETKGDNFHRYISG